MIEKITFRVPTSEDGLAVNRLVDRCPPLDANSVYCNLLQCTHFAATSLLAEYEGDIVGFVSGYAVPDRPTTLFVWQVMVDEKARGLGLAKRMIVHLLARLGDNFDCLETTVTTSNVASERLFKGLAQQLGASCQVSPLFRSEQHFDGMHETELLFSISPIKSNHQ